MDTQITFSDIIETMKSIFLNINKINETNIAKHVN